MGRESSTSQRSVTMWGCGPPRGSRTLTCTSRCPPVAFLLFITCPHQIHTQWSDSHRVIWTKTGHSLISVAMTHTYRHVVRQGKRHQSFSHSQFILNVLIRCDYYSVLTARDSTGSDWNWNADFSHHLLLLCCEPAQTVPQSGRKMGPDFHISVIPLNLG